MIEKSKNQKITQKYKFIIYTRIIWSHMQWVSIFQSLGCNSLQSQWENHTDLQYTMNRKLLATIQLSLHFSWLIKNPLPLKRSPNPYDTDKWTTDIMTHIKSSTNEGKMWFTNRHKADASQRCEPQMRATDVSHRCETEMWDTDVSPRCEPEMWATAANPKCEPHMRATNVSHRWKPESQLPRDTKMPRKHP